MARDPVKTARRASLRARRRDLAAARDTARDDHDLAGHVGALVDTLGLGPGSVVTSYASIPGEPPTARLNAMLAERGIRVLLPVTLPDLDLDWHDAADPGEQPLGREAVAAVDLILAPGLSVDHSGTRMGQGGGCYDRALTRCDPRPPTVVLLHPGELVAVDDAPLPREPHDRGVDAVLTAEGLVDLGLSPWSSPRGAG